MLVCFLTQVLGWSRMMRGRAYAFMAAVPHLMYTFLCFGAISTGSQQEDLQKDGSRLLLHLFMNLKTMFGNVAVLSTVLTHCQSVHMTRDVSQLVIIACTCTCWSCTGSGRDLAYCMTHFCLLFCQCHSFLPAEHYSRFWFYFPVLHFHTLEQRFTLRATFYLACCLSFMPAVLDFANY